LGWPVLVGSSKRPTHDQFEFFEFDVVHRVGVGLSSFWGLACHRPWSPGLDRGQAGGWHSWSSSSGIWTEDLGLALGPVGNPLRGALSFLKPSAEPNTWSGHTPSHTHRQTNGRCCEVIKLGSLRGRGGSAGRVVDRIGEGARLAFSNHRTRGRYSGLLIVHLGFSVHRIPACIYTT